MRQKRATPAQRIVLENMAAGRDAGAHLRSRSDYGGFTATLRTIYRRGWADAHGITDAGRNAIAKAAKEDGRVSPAPAGTKEGDKQ